MQLDNASQLSTKADEDLDSTGMQEEEEKPPEFSWPPPGYATTGNDVLDAPVQATQKGASGKTCSRARPMSSSQRGQIP